MNWTREQTAEFVDFFMSAEVIDCAASCEILKV